jgi:hypothetical protein
VQGETRVQVNGSDLEGVDMIDGYKAPTYTIFSNADRGKNLSAAFRAWQMQLNSLAAGLNTGMSVV